MRTGSNRYSIGIFLVLPVLAFCAGCSPSDGMSVQSIDSHSNNNDTQDMNSTSGEREQPAPAPAPAPSTLVGACMDYNPVFIPANFDRVLENFDRTTTLRIEGSQWDNTLIRNCRIRNANGDGIFLKNVKNVVITNCEISNVTEEGIRTSSTGSTENIQIVGNRISNTGGDGIASAQRTLDGVDSLNLIIANNRISDTGLNGIDGKLHGIYSQASGAVITGNHILGIRDGNGISFRSSGRISCNLVEGTSKNQKPGIRYFSDHSTGIPSILTIEKNEVHGQVIGINIYRPVASYEGSTSYNHVVKSFVIRDNTISANTTPLSVDPIYLDNSTFSVSVSGNR